MSVGEHSLYTQGLMTNRTQGALNSKAGTLNRKMRNEHRLQNIIGITKKNNKKLFRQNQDWQVLMIENPDEI